jgi:Fe-S-cluster containining protein
MSPPNFPFRFRLRDEILLDGAALRDPLTGTVYPLDALGYKIIKALDATWDVKELITQAAHLCTVSRDEVERALRQMLLLGLFEDTCGTIRERLKRIRSGERLLPHVLEGSRFGCQNSGACCRGYVFGPVDEHEKARIEALDPRKALPYLGASPLFIDTGLSSGRRSYRLGTSGEACVFLDRESRCGLHRIFGPSAKPALCQLYPLAAVATIDGLKIYDRGECATFAVSTGTGTLLEEDIPRIRALVDEDIYHPMAQVHGSWRCDYGLILALARRLDLEANSKSPLEALHAIGHVARSFIVALTRCPFEAGQPEAAVDAALQCSAKECRPSEATVATNARAGLRAMAILAGGLVERVTPHEALSPFFMETASLLAEICRRVLGEDPISERARGALSISMQDDCERTMRLSLRQQLFGRELLLEDSLPAGLLRMVFVVTLTLAGARLRALDDGRNKVLPQHLSTRFLD